MDRLMAEGTLAHAYMFTGLDGVGKRMVAEDIAHFLVPQAYESDVLHLAPIRDEETGKVKDISIEDVRDLKSWIYLRPLGSHKVIIIDGAEKLGDEAANTLLKVLEEPPAYAVFFLVTSMPNWIISTIASRCERVDFLPLTDDEMSRILSGYKLKSDDLQLLQAVAAGKPGLAINLIQNDKLSEVARSIAEFQKIVLSNTAEKIMFSKKLAENDEVQDAIKWWLAYIHYRLPQKPQLAALANGLMDLSFALSQPHYNRRLAIENFFLTASVPK